jgi:antirestriction protein ArdC
MGGRFGDAAYATEELVAEIASAFLCAELGITQDTRAEALRSCRGVRDRRMV